MDEENKQVTAEEVTVTVNQQKNRSKKAGREGGTRTGSNRIRGFTG